MLTFCVSGMLWNRSLVMMDKETESLWSHLLGRCMRGTLEGTELEMLPSTMATWEAWRQAHPQTTVLNLRRTHENYTASFYGHLNQFVLGWIQGGQAYACSFTVLEKNPVLGIEVGDDPVLLTFDASSTAAQLYARRLDEQILDFEPLGNDQMEDRQTRSRWNRNTGIAVAGPLKGKQLQQQAGIVSYARAWAIFHPQSIPITVPDDSDKRGQDQ